MWVFLFLVNTNLYFHLLYWEKVHVHVSADSVLTYIYIWDFLLIGDTV